MKYFLSSKLFTFFLTATLLVTLFSCVKEDDEISDPIVTIVDPITLGCSDFSGDVVLINNPNAPVDYIIDCKVGISNELVIEAGTVVHFTSAAGLVIGDNGTIKFIGTETERITLDGVNGVKGDWLGILIESNSAVNTIAYTDILNSGGGAMSGKEGAIIIWADAKLNMTNSKIENSATYGLNCSFWNYDFTNSDNVFTNNNYPVKILFSDVDQLSATSTYTGNTNDFIEVGARTIDNNHQSTLKDLGLPYYFSAFNQGVTQYAISSTSGLTIEKNVTIYFGDDTYIQNDGYLIAKGTMTEPIKFLGLTALSGFWRGIETNSSSVQNILDYTEIRHTGSSVAHSNIKAAISMWYDANLTLSNSIISDCAGTCAVNRGTSVGSGTLTETGNTFNGLTLCTF